MSPGEQIREDSSIIERSGLRRYGFGTLHGKTNCFGDESVRCQQGLWLVFSFDRSEEGYPDAVHFKYMKAFFAVLYNEVTAEKAQDALRITF